MAGGQQRGPRSAHLDPFRFLLTVFRALELDLDPFLEFKLLAFGEFGEPDGYQDEAAVPVNRDGLNRYAGLQQLRYLLASWNHSFAPALPLAQALAVVV